MKTPTLEVTINTEVVIIRNLTNLGVPANLMGYEYLKFGLSKVLENPVIIRRMTKELYPAIAQEYGTTPSQVERAIRHAVEVMFDRVDPELLRKYFGNTISIKKDKPTNSEFLAQVAEHIRIELGAYK